MVLDSKKINVNDVVVKGIISVLDKTKGRVWIGTMTALGAKLVKVLGSEQASILPKSPSALRVVINRVINRLRNKKMSIKFGILPTRQRVRFVKFDGR